MFHPDFFPTPLHVIEQMLQDEKVAGKVILEPSAGAGDIVDYLLREGAADVITAEINDDLRVILAAKCMVIAGDFLTIQSDQISHIDLIVMNPPFSAGDKHILHAYNIAPPGCKIIALCNMATIKDDYSKTRRALGAVIETYGSVENLGNCFASAERKTDVEVGLIRIQKPGGDTQSEFEGFFLDEDPEEQADAIMPYNFIRDLVNRYVGAIKIYDQQLDAAVRMNALTDGFYGSSMAMTITEEGKPKARNDYKKDLQKAAWTFIFGKMNMKKYATRGLREDINKFVERQTHIPFTMRNIYRMLEIVIGTQAQRMDKALLEVFDKLTEHHHDNRYFFEGWKTNSHFLVSKKFILPNLCYQDQRWYKGECKIRYEYGNYTDFIEDLVKALCYISGDRYEKLGSLRDCINYPYKILTDDEIFYSHSGNGHDGYILKLEELQRKGIQYQFIYFEPLYGEWFEWAYFRVKAFKKGSMHFEFKDPDLWGQFNQRIAKLKGYPLFEYKEQTAYQKRQTGRA